LTHSMTPTLFILFIVTLFIALVLIVFVWLRPRILTWGATNLEISCPMAGDEHILEPILFSTRAITIKACVSSIWPWLAQMGQSRGGFYSYDWLENLLGMDIHNSDQIIPELQAINSGDVIPFWRGAGIKVKEVLPQELLVLAGTLNAPLDHHEGEVGVGGTWVFQLKVLDLKTTRLIVRSRVAEFKPVWLSSLLMRVLEPLHFFMERRMLVGIKTRAESLQAQSD
jgi:hypothetical protein